ncbi:carbohydrate kinase family protein [Nibricoccus sp. IMCC34717]|uniref:carbohydrate kinase family protein n=1 Tax=Nibricoccus sp. IMCC34717 TaxID=3034021 RepID=UPI00385117EC
MATTANLPAPPDETFDVLVVGELNVDLILNQVQAVPVVGKEVMANTMDLVLGSSSAIFASNLRAMGVRTAFCGLLGNDSFGDLILDCLKGRGVDTRWITRVAGEKTGATVVMNFGNDRANVTYAGAMARLSCAHVPADALTRCRHMHVSSVFLQEDLRRTLIPLFKQAKEAGLTTSLDPQWDPSEQWDLPIAELLPLVDVFLPNRQELLALTRRPGLEEAVDALAVHANLLVVKDGVDGALAARGQERWRAPAFLNDRVVDCIGAGDSFDAGFVRAMLHGAELSECLSYAALTGALNTTAAGGTAAFSNWETARETARQRWAIDPEEFLVRTCPQAAPRSLRSA